MHNILATISISEDVDDPKINGVRSGYSPHHKFAGVDFLVSGIHEYVDDRLHYPGEVLEASIRFVSWEYFKDKVKVGDDFEVRELNRVVGVGKINKILE